MARTEKDNEGIAFPLGTLGLEMCLDQAMREATELKKSPLWNKGQLIQLVAVHAQVAQVLGNVIKLKTHYEKTKKAEEKNGKK